MTKERFIELVGKLSEADKDKNNRQNRLWEVCKSMTLKEQKEIYNFCLEIRMYLEDCCI